MSASAATEAAVDGGSAPTHHTRQHTRTSPTRCCGRTVGKPQTQATAPIGALETPHEAAIQVGSHSKVLRTPSRGSVPFSEVRCTNRYATAYLTATFRSQGFSPSQRLDPRTSLWLCFAPHPLVGFWTFRASPARISRGASRHPMLSCR
jgi:hypothetical protein